MQEVEVQALPLELLTSILAAERAQRLAASADKARAMFGNRTIWHVSATAHGGGVAEMLQTLLAYGRGAQIENRWLVLDGRQDFFAITKRVHNLLHGDAGDGGPLGAHEHAVYEEVLAPNVAEVTSMVSSRDIVLLHDPQTAGIVDGLREAGVRVAWRCHVGWDERNEQTDLAWEFLRGYIEAADAFVFSRVEYVPDWLDHDRLVIIPPSIDPFSAKNRDLEPETVSAILATVGLFTGIEADGPVEFERRDGSRDTVRAHRNLIADGPPPPYDARLVLQVSRWDRLKDMAGVMMGFAMVADDGPQDAHLMLVGPDVSGVTDDPEGAEVLAEVVTAWQELPQRDRQRVHLALLPMADPDENAIMVNALQRRADVVTQMSLAEGFGLTVAEAMWKARPVVATGVGGIRDQIEDGRTGFLVGPHDLAAYGARVSALLKDPHDAERIGQAAQARVRDAFLGPRHLGQYVDLLERVLTEAPPHVPIGARP